MRRTQLRSGGGVPCARVFPLLLCTRIQCHQQTPCVAIATEADPDWTPRRAEDVLLQPRTHRVPGAEKKFACQFCTKTFKFQSSINRHLRTHTGTWDDARKHTHTHTYSHTHTHTGT